jgi:MoxR-like ATPase
MSHRGTFYRMSQASTDQTAADRDQLEQHHRMMRDVIDGLERILRGKRSAVELLVVALVTGGHVLIEDLPGLGKTTLAKALAALIDGATFKRIQFTPDLLPYDITGVDVFDPERREFVFNPGPVFANIVLADEINRTTPKVQSALLEVMAEQQVTIGNRTHTLSPLFFVVGTQNPVEIEGTYPLPLAQVDRFLMKVGLGYPDEDVELDIVRDDPSHRVLPFAKPVVSVEQILAAREAAASVYCEEQLMRAAVAACRRTREQRSVQYGVSPRGSLMVVSAARTHALLAGRDYCTDDDLAAVGPAVLAHRLVVSDRRVDPVSVVSALLMEELEKLRR